MSFQYSSLCRTCFSSVRNTSQMFYLDFVEPGTDLISIRNKLRLCFPELNLDNTPNAFLCEDCLDTINTIYSFVYQYIKMEAIVNRFFESEYFTLHMTTSIEMLQCIRNDGIKNICDIEHSRYEKYSDMCRICLRPVIKYTKPITSIVKQLWLCCPDLNCCFIPKEVLCKNCYGTVNIMYNFKNRCYKVENQITEFLKYSILMPNLHRNPLNIKEEIKSEEIEIDDVLMDERNLNKILTKKHYKSIPNSYECFLCNSQTNTKSNMISHLQITHKYINIKLSKKKTNHKPTKTYKCSKCDHITKYKHNLKQHNMLVHSTEKPFKCTTCTYSAKLPSHLKEHLLSHSSEKPFKCGECGHSAVTKYHLKRHKLTHADKKRFKCEFCSYHTNYNQLLKEHMFTHTLEKPFSCANCLFSTTRKNRLERHMSTHTDLRPFKCMKCKYSTKRSYILTMHMLTHNDKYTLKCSKCDYTTKQKSKLRNHVQIHLYKKLFKCTECDYNAKTKYYLQIHKLKHTRKS